MSTDTDDGQSAIAEESRPWETMLHLAESGEVAELDAFVETMSSAEQAHALGHLDGEEAEKIFQSLDPTNAAELLSHLAEAQAAQLVSNLEPETAAAIVHELPSDEQADVMGDLEQPVAEAILDSMPRDEATAVRQMTAYADDVAGGLMVNELLTFDDRMTVAQVIDQLSREQERYSDYDIRYGYVCDADTRLVGVLPMASLLFVNRSQPVRDVMIPNPLTVDDKTDLRSLVDFFEDHRFLGVPVVDEQGVLKGVVHREAVDYAEARAIESGYMKSQGIVGGEELRTMPLSIRSRRRLSWLSINILLNICAASVIAFFQETLQSVIALAVFLPIISDMSGCSGNQAVAVSMRELSLGLVRPNEILRVWLKEVSVGLINGFSLGVLIALLAWFYNGNPYLGLVVGVALMTNTIIAVSIGGTVPLLLRRLGFDPAVASGPLLTTVTDMCGFFLVLGLATVMLSKLV